MRILRRDLEHFWKSKFYRSSTPIMSLMGFCHDPQCSGACQTYFPRPQTRRVDPRSILAEQRTMPDEATKVGMWNTDAHICAPSLFSSQCVYIYPEYPKEEEFNDPVRYKAAIKHTLAQINSGCWNGMINGWNKNA